MSEENKALAPSGRGVLHGGAADAQHTPGPWLIDGVELAVIKTALCSDGSWRFIAEAIINGPMMSAEEIANARLIAAAPELLGELKRMVDHFDAFAKDHSIEATPETWAALHCAKAIIAKAEGASAGPPSDEVASTNHTLTRQE